MSPSTTRLLAQDLAMSEDALAALLVDAFVGLDTLDKVDLEAAILQLPPEGREILARVIALDQHVDDIGVIIGRKYREDGEPITGSAVRYHKKKYLKRLRDLMYA